MALEEIRHAAEKSLYGLDFRKKCIAIAGPGVQFTQATPYLSARLFANTGFSTMPSISKLPASRTIHALIDFHSGL